MTRRVVHNGTEYELRGALIGVTYRAAVFHNNQRISGDAIMSFDNAVDFLGGSAFEFLFNSLETLIKSGAIHI